MAFDHRWYKLRRDTVRLPDGRVVEDYYVSQRPNVAIVVPRTPENNFILVRQYKHGSQAITLEFTAGTFQLESAETAAVRELEEETGYSPTNIMSLGTCFDDSTTNSNLVHMFIASGCTATGKQRLDELEAASGVEVVLMSLHQVITALDDGDINPCRPLRPATRRSAHRSMSSQRLAITSPTKGTDQRLRDFQTAATPFLWERIP